MSTPLSITDLYNLYKPGQLSDLVSMLRTSLMALTSATFSAATQGDIVSLGPSITAVRTNSLVAGVINTAGPNAPKINTALAKYAVIPTFLSGYKQPTLITDQVELAKNNRIFGPIITYLDTCLDEFCNTVVFFIIKDNMNTTNATTIDGIKKVIVSFLAFINNVPTKIKIPETMLHPNFGETSSRLADILSRKLGVSVVQPNSITWKEISPLADASINHAAKAIRTFLSAIVTAKTIDKYNSPKNVLLIKSIPSLIEEVATLSDDPLSLNYLPKFSTMVVPIPEDTRSLFTSLTTKNYSTNVSQLPAGIMNYLITSTLGTLSTRLVTYLAALEGRVIFRGFSSFDLVDLVTANCIATFKPYIKILNTIINIFQIKLKDDPVIIIKVRFFNNISKKNKFMLNEMPTASGGKRTGRSKTRRRTLKRRGKNLTPK